MHGHWEKGPGMELFQALQRRLGAKEIIAEDLGLQTPSVHKLLKDSGYPGMKVLEFAFVPGKDTGYLPHSYDRNCVVYTGTHDNETLVQWYQGLDEEVRTYAAEYMDKEDGPAEEKYRDFVRMAMMSSADTCIIPLQDYLGLGQEARINKPSTLGGNWVWRMDEGMLSREIIDEIYGLTKISFRLNGQEREETKGVEVTGAVEAAGVAEETEAAGVAEVTGASEAAGAAGVAEVAGSSEAAGVAAVKGRDLPDGSGGSAQSRKSSDSSGRVRSKK